jgi:putative ABC transport system permease protein
MWKHQLQISFRNLFKRKQITLINILGLSIGLTIFILINLYLDHQWNHDSFQEKRHRIYRIESNFGGITAAPVAPYLAQSHPEIEKYTRFVSLTINLQNPESIHTSDQIFPKVLIADPEVTDIFTFDFILGNPHKIIETRNQMAISESLATKLFGNESPLGKTIIGNSEFRFTITGVFRDLPSNSMIKTEALTNFKFVEDFWSRPKYTEQWECWSFESYLLLSKGVNVQQIIPKLAKDFQKGYKVTDNEDEYPFTLIPFTELYFHQVMDWWHHGNKKNLILFSAISIFILLIACINFINITTAYAGQRAKEIGLKKVVGAERHHLRTQFLLETLLLSYISIIIAITLTEILLPSYSALVNNVISLEYTLRNIVFLLLILPMILSILAGFYPAIILSSFNISEVLKGEFTKGKKSGKFRKILTVTQFAIGIFLVIGTIGLYQQMNFIQTKDPGFQKEHLVYLPANKKLDKQFGAFKELLNTNPNIVGIARSNQPIENLQEFWGVKPEGNLDKENTCKCFWVDPDFLEIMQLELIQGRNFREGKADLDKTMIINEKFAKKYFPEGAIGKKVNKMEVIGVVKDFHYNSMHTPIEPITIGYSFRNTNFYAIRLSGNQIQETTKYIEAKWKEIVPEYPFLYFFLDDQFDKLYKDDRKYLKLFLIFSGLAIFLACLGLFAMASFIAERKTKEIGVRKVLGAPVGNIIFMLSKEFTQWVVVANLIAWPAAWFFLKKWLTNFAYRIEIEWYYFVTGALFALLIALVTILTHTLKTARKNPVESLKYE